MQLKGKYAIVYGGAGAVGSAVARAFAREGATVFLAGRTIAGVEAIARDIGGTTEAAEVDALWRELSQGGTTVMELGKYPFSERYGWLQDRYGLRHVWLIKPRSALPRRKMNRPLAPNVSGRPPC